MDKVEYERLEGLFNAAQGLTKWPRNIVILLTAGWALFTGVLLFIYTKGRTSKMLIAVSERGLRILFKCAGKLLTPRRLRRLQYMFFRATLVAKEVLKMNNALIIYFSKTGNTRKVALAIKEGLEKGGMEVTIKRVDEAIGEELYNYDLVCFGSPVLHSLPPPPVFKFIRKNEKRYRDAREVHVSSPKVINKNALVFCTYSGPHCGINEALPVGKYIRQFFEHLGFDVKGEWYEVGEFHGWEDGSTRGRLGDIRGRPSAEDLALVELKTVQLVRSL